jgi:sugar phosphate isomerase/epimerase
MQLGIFAKTFQRPTLEQTLDAVASHGLTHIQFNMSCMGLATLPDKLDEGSCVWISQMFQERGLTMAAISGTFNMVDPNSSRLEHNLHRLDVLAGACRWLDTRIITLCTGSLDAHDMWKWHPDNSRKSTWERLVETMRAAVAIADRYEVTLAFEPEINNVVSSVMRARRLLDEIGSPWLKVVIDPANLLHSGDLSQLGEMLESAGLLAVLSKVGLESVFDKGRFVAILDEAFDWLGAEIILAHAKNPPGIEDAVDSGKFEDVLGAWSGPRGPVMEDLFAKLETEEGRREFHQTYSWSQFYQPYLAGLKNAGFSGALIMHGLSEDQVKIRTSFLREVLQSVAANQD